ncbi:MAG: hypothetical protein QM611_00935 [Microbacterium sp.]|uniref:hypothetical protein n=1 Tax=Microbacterium sp. TaxID=51671 RepID=UPI0039E6854A
MATYGSTKTTKSAGALAAAITAALVGALAIAPSAQAADDEVFCDVPGEELAISPISGLEDDQPVTWKSTTKGTEPTEFPGTYVGKLENGLGYDANGNPRDLLLVELGGPIVEGSGTTLAAGVWAGASGSPVYDADGALIGAVSYGFSWLPDNVAGVTPAAYMKTIGQLPGVQKVNTAAQKKIDKIVDGAPLATKSQARIEPLKPVRVTFGGTADDFDQASATLAEKVEGYTAAAQGGLAIDGGALDGEDYPIVAGGNIAVTYAYGAVGSASVGTVTAVCGDEVFAYGHPAYWNSEIGASFHGASAARVVPDLETAYKQVSAIGKPKGRITEDRLAGIRGVFGDPAPSIPITTVSKIGSHTSTAVTHVSFDLMNPDVAYVQLMVDAQRMLDNAWAGSAKVKWSIRYQREDGSQGTFTNYNRYADSQAFPDLLGFDVADNIATLMANPYEEVEILGVDITTRFAEGFRAARVSGVEMKKNGAWKKVEDGSAVKVTRGKTHTFRTVLAPVPGAERVTEYQEFSVTVPQRLKKSMSLRVSASPQYDDETEAGDFDSLIAELDNPVRYDVISVAKRWRSTSNAVHASEKTLVTPTFIVDDGSGFSFTLEAAALKKG